ncbi:hypothetical protein G5B37_04625 [Rasiella rasia]|uniref:DUF4412 domain-containing protein n=1 Tax=Rasiella rasia TaxID=2744027 RepID=A0A6G6GK51_9FLAO|nr:hypothetical protein [Rasiella rasia]QIE58870.1 hypothetical protein G5B37_04625 [Rasiella rasia]
MKLTMFISIALVSTIAYCQSFTGSFDFVVAQENQNGNVRTDTVSYFFSKNQTAIIIHAKKNEDLRLLFNPTDSTITGLYELNGTKGGYILPMNKKYWPGMHHALLNDSLDTIQQKESFGDTKRINEYDCHEISCNNANYEGTFWTTDKIAINLIQILAYQSVGAGEDTDFIDMLSDCGVSEFAMEASFNDKKRESQITARIINLSDTINTAAFSVEGHLLSDMRKEK